jgi:type IV pilus assembly protein PilC
MPQYQYEAKTFKGEMIKGTVEASDEAAVIDILMQRSYFPMNIKPYKESVHIDLSLYKKATLKDIALFCRQFSFVLSAGINILRALEIAKEQTENKRLKKMMEKVFEDVQRGQALSEAMRTHKELPEMLINMIEVGEASGTLDRIMDRMASYYDKEFRQRQKVKQALTYPAVVSVFSVIVVIILMVKVLPTFIDMFSQFPNAKMPVTTLFLMGMSNFLATKWWLLIIIVAAIITLLKVYSSTEEGSYNIDNIKIRTPIFGRMFRKVITARFARTFGMLMGSGVPLMQCVDISADIVGNKVYSKALSSMRGELEKGSSLGEILEKEKLFPNMLTQMIRIGEESGTLDNILEKTAEFYDAEVETATTQLTVMLEPAIMVVLAIVVGFIVISIITPMFEMYNAIGA